MEKLAAPVRRNRPVALEMQSENRFSCSASTALISGSGSVTGAFAFRFVVIRVRSYVYAAAFGGKISETM